MAATHVSKSSDENDIAAEKAELLTRIYLGFDDKKQMFTWSGDIEALKELCRQDLDIEPLKVLDNGNRSTSLKAKSVTLTLYKSTKSLQIEGSDVSIVKAKLRLLLQQTSSAQWPQASQTFQIELQISCDEPKAMTSIVREEESLVVADNIDNTDQEQLIASHQITKELGDMKKLQNYGVWYTIQTDLQSLIVDVSTKLRIYNKKVDFCKNGLRRLKEKEMPCSFQYLYSPRHIHQWSS